LFHDSPIRRSGLLSRTSKFDAASFAFAIPDPGPTDCAIRILERDSVPTGRDVSQWNRLLRIRTCHLQGSSGSSIAQNNPDFSRNGKTHLRSKPGRRGSGPIQDRLVWQTRGHLHRRFSFHPRLQVGRSHTVQSSRRLLGPKFLDGQARGHSFLRPIVDSGKAQLSYGFAGQAI